MKKNALFLSLVLLLITSLSGFTFENSIEYYMSPDVDNYFTTLAKHYNAVIISDTISKADNRREILIDWGDNIISEIVQKQTNDGSEEYIIKESDITNELVIKPSGEILVDGNLAIAINATDVCSVENADLSINSGIGTMANAVKYETTSPLVGSSTQYNTLTNTTAYQSVAFSNAISGITFSVFVTLVTGGCTWYFNVGGFWAGTIGCLTSAATGGLTNVYDFLKMTTPTATSAKYKVFTYSYSGNTLTTHAEQAVTRFYTNANVMCGTGGIKYVTLVI